ncbi:VAN3-binding protein isoform X3 [Prosopis cineraria]|uniref:VAN3-binding protein isoform X3 n=1 Tax=Prosopis cineraria TaxID=364024 RepID=UPI00240F9655|nr:VAN3-binding protein isoform X3 [Prosopis cineraria]
MSSSNSKCSVKGLEKIDENGPIEWSAVSCAPPETPTESMEFLARSWSLSAMELSKALNNTNIMASTGVQIPVSCPAATKASPASKDSLTNGCSPPISARGSEEMKELFLLHQALNPEFLSAQHLLRNGLYRSLLKGKTMGRWLKDQKERKKQELRTHNAQLHAAVSVAGVAAAVAAVAASTASPDMPFSNNKDPPRNSSAIASAAALVASHCIEIAEDMGADHGQILTAVNSAINAKTNGDIMTLTAGAATALRGAATLKARLQKGIGSSTFPLAEERFEEGKEANMLTALDCVFRGGELLKRTRKGDLHWKQVSFVVNSNLQVVAKLKSKHMGGTFKKKKKCKQILNLLLTCYLPTTPCQQWLRYGPNVADIVTGVCSDMPAWPEREREDGIERRAYFGLKTADRIIEFECASKHDKQIWIEGIKYMLNCRAKLT